MLPLWVGQRSGLFRAHGLDVQIVDTEGGSRGLAQVGTGRLQVMIVGLSAVIDANRRGGQYRLVASGANTMSFRFFGAAGLHGGDTLKGKKVGVSTFGSESDSAATVALKRLGLTRADVQIVESGGTLTRLNALISGQIAATALNEPADTQARRKGLPLLVDLKADLPWIFTAIAVDKSYIKSHGAELRQFLEGWLEGIDLALSDPVRAKAALAAEFRDLPADTIDATYEDFRERVPRDAAPSQEGAELMLAQAFGDRSFRTQDYIDTSVLDDLRSSGFVDQAKRRFRVP
jgi:ABC-type nitrate/sulfonate/bicarbonate transport system substrate-binding protein